MPRFSIIIPVHNSEAFMRKCLDSVKMQTFTDYELFVVLDACTDGSKAIAKEYGAKIIEVDFRDNGLAKNIAIQKARGDYVLFLDSDDWWIHEYVLDMLDKELQIERPDILFFSYIIKGIGYITPVDKYKYPAFWNKAWRRNFIQKIQVQPRTFGSDMVFQADALARNPKIADCDILVYYYNHMRKGSVTELRNRK